MAALIVSAFFHFRSPNIPDPDALLHIRHAWLYQTNSLWDTQFPWVYYSAIRSFGADLWYGFHLFLIPFTFSENLVTGVKFAGVILTTLLLLAYAWTATRAKLAMKFFWPFLFLLAVPNVLFQLLMVRPHIISLGLGVLLLSFLIKGPWWPVFLLSAGLTFFHLSFFWFVFLIAAVIFGLQIIFWFKDPAAKPDWLKVLGVVLGAVAGWILRPEFWNTAKLIYIQVFKLMLEKSSDLPLLFSRELSPLGWSALVQTSFMFLIMWLAAITFLAWAIVKNRQSFQKIEVGSRIFLWGNLLLSLAFFLMSMFVARRAYMFWVAFGVLFIGAAYTYLISKKTFKNSAMGALIFVFLIMIFYADFQNSKSMAVNAAPPSHLKESALWLKENSSPGDIVFNTHWDNFSMLFLWNQKNYYISGMDPIFQYAYSPDLYWKFHHISKDEATDQTCGDLECRPENQKDTYAVLKEDFNAKYVFVEKRRNPIFCQFLTIDPRFEQKFDNGKEMIFLVR